MRLPFSSEEFGTEHVVNVSGKEIPELTDPLSSWVKRINTKVIQEYQIGLIKFSEYQVLPRLLFRQYLTQFKLIRLSRIRKGSRLTAMHAVRTIARASGSSVRHSSGGFVVCNIPRYPARYLSA